MRRAKAWFSLTGLLTVLGMVASLGVAASPASAYSPNPTAVTATRDTDLCPCVIKDTADGTVFKYDAGGQAVKVSLFHNGSMVGKVEFHPYGEYLWIYDTKADGDAIYVTLTAEYSVIGLPDTRFPSSGAYKSPPAGDDYGYRVENLSIQEGIPVTIRVYDGSGPSDHIVTVGGGVA